VKRIAVLGAGALALAAGLVVAHPAIDPAAAHSGDQLAIVTAWLAALVFAGWLALSSAIAIAAIVRPRAAPHLLACTPRLVRRLVEVALVGSCIVGSAVPASATSAHPARAVLVVRDDPVVRAPAPPAASPTSYVVQPGDNLWRIAARTMSTSSDGELVRYWQALVSLNRPHLRSGDPNLIYPGEVVTLPAKPPTQ
jgi:nucleoid-associated protein YgaU